MIPIIEPFLKDKAFQVLQAPNLAGAKYTLRFDFVADAGLKDFATSRASARSWTQDLRDRAGQRRQRADPEDDRREPVRLAGFRLVESSEAGMLIEVQRPSTGTSSSCSSDGTAPMNENSR